MTESRSRQSDTIARSSALLVPKAFSEIINMQLLQTYIVHTSTRARGCFKGGGERVR